MEVSASSVTGSARLALQVVSNHKRPMLEVYWELRNRETKPFEVPVTNVKDEEVDKYTYTGQEIFIQFYLVNIGGMRAEDVCLEYEGNTTFFFREMVPAILSGEEIFHMPPGQRVHLCIVDEHMLYEVGPDGKQTGIKDIGFEIDIRYNGSRSGLNRILRWWAKLRNKTQYQDKFKLNNKLFDGYDLPPIESWGSR